MRWSEMLIPTLREAPAEADSASHRLLLRAGYARLLAPGVAAWLPLGRRALSKIASIIREELAGIGAQELLLPALLPAEPHGGPGGAADNASAAFRLPDHAGRPVLRGAALEFLAAAIARRALHSYRQLPQVWFQIATRFRDEPRPRGLLRLRQFLAADFFSFATDAAGLAECSAKLERALRRLLDRCGLAYLAAESNAGGAAGREFFAPADAGDGALVRCAGCGYAAALSAARARPADVQDDTRELPPEPFATPGVRTIEQLAAFTGAPPSHFLKTLAWMAGDELLLALVRGDDELNEAKLAVAAGTAGGGLRPARAEEIREKLGAAAGFIGPVGVPAGGRGVRILADEALRGRRNLLAGANRDDTHLRNVTPGEDFQPRWADLRTARAGDACSACAAPVEIRPAIALGYVRSPGTATAEATGASVLDAAGGEAALQMSAAGLGLERLLAAAVEQHHDEDGMALPASLAPFAVVVTPTNPADEAIARAAGRLYAELRAAGVETLLDDRDERPGVKFKDADLVGIPWRITVGRKVQDGNVELRCRSTRTSRDATLSDAVSQLRASLETP